MSVDGSFLQLPRVESIRKAFLIRQNGDCPSAGVTALYDVLNDWALDATITNAKMDERIECEKHIDFLCGEFPDVAKKSILLLDRGFPSLRLITKLSQLDVKFVMRCSTQFLSEINDAPMGDTNVVLSNGICVRVVKFKLSSDETEILVSNLFGLPTSDFPQLYAKRWGIETMYHTIKKVLCVEKFSGKTENTILQDFWVTMVLLNCVAVFTKESDKLVKKQRANKQNKHKYKTRVSDLVVTLRDRFIFCSLCGVVPLTDTEIKSTLEILAYSVTADIKNRSFPRNPKPHLNANHSLKSHL